LLEVTAGNHVAVAPSKLSKMQASLMTPAPRSCMMASFISSGDIWVTQAESAALTLPDS